MLLVITSLSEQLTGNMSAVSLAATWSRDTTAPPSLVGLSAPAPEVDGGPVRDVEDDEEDWEHTEEDQVSPGEPEVSQWQWSREMKNAISVSKWKFFSIKLSVCLVVAELRQTGELCCVLQTLLDIIFWLIFNLC